MNKRFIKYIAQQIKDAMNAKYTKVELLLQVIAIMLLWIVVHHGKRN